MDASNTSASLITQFKDFGFTLYESKAYVALVTGGIMSAPETSKKSGVPKSKIYDTLNNLLNKRIIEEYPGSPRKFKARSPGFVLDELVEQEKLRLENIQSSADSLRSRLDSIISNTEKTYISDDSVLWTVNGRRGFHEKFAEMGSRARKEVKVITPYFSRNSILEKAINKARSEGVIFKGITSINEDNKDRVKYYLECFDSIEQFNGEIPITLVIIDEKECMYRIDYRINGLLNYVGVHSTNIGLIKAFTQYWNGLKADSVPIKTIQ